MSQFSFEDTPMESSSSVSFEEGEGEEEEEEEAELVAAFSRNEGYPSEG